MAPDLCCYCYKVFKFLVNIPYHSWNRTVYSNRSLLSINSVLDKCILPRYISTGHFLLSEKKFRPIGKKGIVKQDGTVVKVKTKIVPQIKLIDEKGSMTVVTMEAAKKLAERKKLALVDVTEPNDKGEKRTYQLKSEKEVVGFDRETESGSRSKSKKLLIIKTNIHDHDLQSKINIMIRNVTKGHEVRIILEDVIYSNNLETCFQKIEEKVKDVCKIKNKARKDKNRLAFELEPITEKNEKENKKVKDSTKAKENENESKDINLMAKQMDAGS